MVKIVEDELTTLMGGTSTDINLKGSPAVILIAGLQGSGKDHFQRQAGQVHQIKEWRNPMLVACDVYRPAAINQLQVLGEQIGSSGVCRYGEQEPGRYCQKAISFAKVNNHNVVIVDTAGRLAVDEGDDG